MEIYRVKLSVFLGGNHIVDNPVFWHFFPCCHLICILLSFFFIFFSDSFICTIYYNRHAFTLFIRLTMYSYVVHMNGWMLMLMWMCWMYRQRLYVSSLCTPHFLSGSSLFFFYLFFRFFEWLQWLRGANEWVEFAAIFSINTCCYLLFVAHWTN